MRILEMIAKWREGCTFSKHNPLNCHACTETLINNIENYASVTLYSGGTTPQLYGIVNQLRDALAEADNQSNILVSTSDLNSLLHEFFRLENLLRLQKPRIPIQSHEENHRVT